MRTRVKGTARAALVTASLAAIGVGTFYPIGAYADTTSGDSSVLGGNQVNAPISVPVNVCGNAVAVLGIAGAGCEGGAKVAKGDDGGNLTSGHHSVLGGNQVNLPISAPVNACGNAVAALGAAGAGCEGGARVKQSGNGYGGGNLTSGDHSVLGGNQVAAPVSLPINICGNAVGNAAAYCEGGAIVHGAGSSSNNSTSGQHSVGGGNQVVAPIKAPVNVCGNAVAVLGDASAGCAGGSSTGGHPGRSGHDCTGHGYQAAGYRTRQSATERIAPGLPVSHGALLNIPGRLPTLPEALPAQSELPVQPELPVEVPQGLLQTPLQGGAPAGARTRTATASPLGDLPVAAPVSLLDALPVTSPVGVPGSLPVQPPAGLPGSLPVQPPTGLPGSLPRTPDLPGALSRAPKLSSTLPVNLPGGGLPVARNLPSQVAPVPAHGLPELPGASDVSAPQVGGVADDVADEVDAAQGSTTGLAPMAKSQLLTSGVNAGSAYVLVVSALLATAAAAMAFTRRIRFGHR